MWGARACREELDIDAADIFRKVRAVLIPTAALRPQRAAVRDNPDFWGPLLVVVAYAGLSVFGQFRVCAGLAAAVFGAVAVLCHCGGRKRHTKGRRCVCIRIGSWCCVALT